MSTRRDKEVTGPRAGRGKKMRDQIYDEILSLWSQVPLTSESLNATYYLQTWLGEDLAFTRLQELLANYPDRNSQALRAVLGFHPLIDETENVDKRLSVFALMNGRQGEAITARRWARRGAYAVADYILRDQFNFRDVLLNVQRLSAGGDWNIEVSAFDYRSTVSAHPDEFSYEVDEAIRDLRLDYSFGLDDKNHVLLDFDALVAEPMSFKLPGLASAIHGSVTWVGRMGWSFSIGSGQSHDTGERYYASECNARPGGFDFSVLGADFPREPSEA